MQIQTIGIYLKQVIRYVWKRTFPLSFWEGGAERLPACLSNSANNQTNFLIWSQDLRLAWNQDWTNQEAGEPLALSTIAPSVDLELEFVYLAQVWLWIPTLQLIKIQINLDADVTQI